MTASGATDKSGWNPATSSEALAVASYLEAVTNGPVTLGHLSVQYRIDYLHVHEGTTGDLSHQGGTLSIDEAKRHLVGSVLPRLVTEGILRSPVPTDADDADATISPTAEALVFLGADGTRTGLLNRARELVHLAEPAAKRPLMEDGSVLRCQGLTKTYKRRTVVSNVDVELRQGEIVGLLGPNGAGKTTTFYMIVGLVKPDEGNIHIDDDNIRRLPMYKRARRGIGYLAQEPSIFRKLTVEQNVMAILETLGINGRERRQRLEGLLDELSIKHLRKTPAYQLSGGERRRLEITRALVTQPKFMLLDEPFAGVDPIAVHDIQTIVTSLRRRGIGVLITDHNVEQTLDIVDRAYIMFEGKVQVAGTVEELVMDDRVAELYLGPTLTARLRERLGAAA